MTEYQFTKDWFQQAPQVWTQLIPMLPDKKSFLEIGSFEGRSTVWIVENMMNPGDWIDCVDTWQGGEEHVGEDMYAVEARFDHNIIKALNCSSAQHRGPEGSWGHTRFASPGNYAESNRVYKYKAKSIEFLGSKLAHWMDVDNLYDFIYIDGSHIAKDVLTDACMAWRLLKPAGLMVFDDYLWGDPRDALHRPKMAIDAFTNIFAEHLDIIHVGHQLVVRKKDGAK
jgi:predicted O-methyltransferase YrrM